MHNLVADVRFAARNLRKSPGFVAVAVITLALGIGVNSAIFSVVNAMLFRPLPYHVNGQIVSLYRPDPETGHSRRWSYPRFEDYRDAATSFRHIVAHSTTNLSVGRGDATEMCVGELVSGDYFQALGARPLLGRLFTPDDDRTPRAHPVTVLSYAYWLEKLSGDPDAVGRTVAVNGEDFTVIGIASEGFTGVQTIVQPALWVTMMMEPIVEPANPALQERGSVWMDAFGIIKPGVSLEQANAELALISANLREADSARDRNELARAYPMRGVMTDPDDRPTMYAMTALVMSMVGMILLIACANIANLLLARATTRRREIGIRLALGSSRSRLVRQLMIESLLLAFAGGLIGLLVGVWAMNSAKFFMPRLPLNVSIVLSFGLDTNMILFALGISALTGVVFGLVPALQAARADLIPALKDDDAGAMRTRRSRLRSTLVVGQVAVSLVLLIASGLFVRSLVQAKAIDPGFEHEHVLSLMLDLDRHQYTAETAEPFCDDLLDRVRRLPGVESACLESGPPLSFNNMTTSFYLEGDPATNDDGTTFIRMVRVTTISGDNFKTLGIPVLMGRDFTDQEMAANTPSVIINQAFAERYWPDENPIGRRISFDDVDGPFLEVVGVVKTVKYESIGESPTPVVYRALPQMYNRSVMLLVRVAGDPLRIAPAVRDVLRDLDPNFSPSDMRPYTEVIGFALLPARAGAALFSLFGVLALLLASVGLYGVMSYMVSQRTHEIGIRMAVGAERRDVLHLILRQGMTLTLIGLGLGLIGAFAFTRVLRVLLYDVSPSDPLTFAGISVLLVVVALLATLIPARRAMKVDPMVALRYE